MFVFLCVCVICLLYMHSIVFVSLLYVSTICLSSLSYLDHVSHPSINPFIEPDRTHAKPNPIRPVSIVGASGVICHCCTVLLSCCCLLSKSLFILDNLSQLFICLCISIYAYLCPLIWTLFGWKSSMYVEKFVHAIYGKSLCEPGQGDHEWAQLGKPKRYHPSTGVLPVRINAG